MKRSRLLAVISAAVVLCTATAGALPRVSAAGSYDLDVTVDLGGSRISYRASPELGCFQLATESTKRYEHNAVLFFDMLSPYLEQAAGMAFPGAERAEIKNQATSCATVEEIRDPEGSINAYAVVIPYNDECIREIRLNVNTDVASIRESCHALAGRINTDRKLIVKNQSNKDAHGYVISDNRFADFGSRREQYGSGAGSHHAGRSRAGDSSCDRRNADNQSPQRCDYSQGNKCAYAVPFF